jgi:hypothetical protein
LKLGRWPCIFHPFRRLHCNLAFHKVTIQIHVNLEAFYGVVALRTGSGRRLTSMPDDSLHVDRRAVLKGALAVGAGVSVAGAGPPRWRLIATAERPRLLIDEKGLARFRRRIAAPPVKRVYDLYVARARSGGEPAIEPLALLAIAGQSGAARAAGLALMRSLDPGCERVRVILSDQVGPGQQPRPGATGPAHDFSGMRFVHRLLNQFDVIDALGGFTPEERNAIEAFVTETATALMSPAIREINARPADRIHNFHTENITVLATAALCFPMHPQAGEWLDYALTDLLWQMEHGVEDGAWHETPRYHGAVLRTLVPLAHALQRCASFDLFANAGFRSMLDWQVRIQTPRDRVYGEWQRDGRAGGPYSRDLLAYPSEAVALIPGVGDAEWANFWFTPLAMAASAYRQTDPAFAGRLMWGWTRAGGPYAPEAPLLLAPMLLIDPSVPALPQQLGSEVQAQGGYAILRSGYDTPTERYLLFSCGVRREDHWASHAHRDLNSISIFADGVPLSLDPGAGPYRTAEHALWHKGTGSHSTVSFGGRDHDREDGRIIKFVSKPGADYVVGDAGLAVGEAAAALQFHRHILFVKPDYFVVWDFLRSWVPTEWRLHSPAREILIDGSRAELITPWGVSLDVHMVLPQAPSFVKGEGRFGLWRDPRDPGRPPFLHQAFVSVGNEPGNDFLAVLHPKRTGASKLDVRRLGTDSTVLEISRGGDRDYVMLFPTRQRFTDEALGIAMDGRVAVVRRGSAGEQRFLLDGRMIRSGPTEITSAN